MKAAKNMDSVFANCTQDELDFDVLFADDDTIIDFIAGVDEAGIPLTGPNFDYTAILAEAEDMLKDPDDEKEREGKVTHNEAPEGSKDVDLEVGAEVGDGKEVTGKEKSGESEAHDMIKLGSETAKNVAVQKAMEIAAKKFADKECCKENSEYEGYEELIEAVVNNLMSEEEIMSENANEMAIATADYLIKECEDQAARDGKVDPDNKGNIEGVKGEVIDQQTKGAATGDPIADDCDQAARDGKVAPDKNVEGVANRIMGAALENASGDIHKDIEDQTLDAGVESMNKDIVSDDVRANTDANKIEPDVVNTQEAVSHEDHVEDAYKELVGGMKIGLQKLALAAAMDESVMETVANICEFAEENKVSFCECEGFDTVVESVIAAMTEDQINMENAAQFAIETAEFIVAEAAKDVLSAKLAGFNPNEWKMNKKTGALEPNSKVIAKALDTKDNVVDAAKNVAGAAKRHPGKAAAIVGTAAAVGTGAAIAAKKIADKKKAAKQNQEEVKENFEYEEYKSLVEAIINDFSKEEVMAENASEMACTIADILIEKAMDAEDLLTNDDDDADIEAIAGNNDPKVDLQYDYDDDELIDMVVNDTNL